MKKTPLLIAAVACSFTTLAPLAVLASPDADTGHQIVDPGAICRGHVQRLRLVKDRR